MEENSVNLTSVKSCSVDNDEYPSFKRTPDEHPTVLEQDEHPTVLEQDEKPTEVEHNETSDSSQIELHGIDTVKIMVAEDIAETEATKTKLASLPSFNWATTAGVFIDCVQDCQADLQSMALERVNLSSRVVPSPSANRLPIPSPPPDPEDWVVTQAALHGSSYPPSVVGFRSRAWKSGGLRGSSSRGFRQTSLFPSTRASDFSCHGLALLLWELEQHFLDCYS